MNWSGNRRRPLARLIATWFGCGYSPVAPGTVGSAAALVMGMALHHYLGWGALEFGLLGVCVLIPGLWAAQAVAVSSGEEDPSIVVIDEVVGQWLTLAGAGVFNWKSWLAAFLLFRLFDIWKPPPVRQLERLRGGAGIMADDVMAGIYGALVLSTAGWFNLY